ncbi:zinc-binding alcohol dehydrogenase family protein [Sandaracinomonas limnophila]|uniref:Zinc-binding alcohol dehydrogenase family protein n=1 Tax=Sandaracinomonas limnophila TaxID=1862386 RepID=A0A437PMW6_9BACT|nr:zinc-binding alcohol dehydrogenase family protein [Sandaracinomonas limnophila]RVU23607.1 zinc-binding alcohol dehydrogenase family protein [Sandaracinomonas limnophila]
MKTLVCTQPGQFDYTTTDYPQEKVGHSILRIKRVGICGTDLHAFEGTQPFFSYPRILGHELGAEIVQTDATDLSIGEFVTVIPYLHCGHCIACSQGKTNCCSSLQVLGVHTDGGMREFVSVPNQYIVKGNGLNVDELALVEPLSIGAHGVKRAGIHKGEFVLVIGAGPIGLGVIEFAKIAGGQVIVMDVNENRLNFCRTNLQVEHVINPTKEDALGRLKSITNQQMPTVVIDATGNLNAINGGLQFLAHSGRYVLVGLQKEAFSFSHPEFHKREATLMSSRNATRSDFEWVMDCMWKGLVNPATYITHRIHFDQIKDQFESFLNPENNVIKAIVKFDS